MKNQITQLDKIIIRIMIQNDLNQISYNKNTYSIWKEDEGIYHYKVNSHHIKIFRIEGNKIVINGANYESIKF